MLSPQIVRLSFIAVGLSLCVYHAKQGLVLSPDSHTYLRWSEALVASGFDLSQWLMEDGKLWMQKLFYLMYVAALAGVKTLGGTSWQALALTLQLSLLIVTLYLWGLTLRILHVPPVWIAVFFFMHLVSVDHLIWPRYLLTDTLYVAGVAFAVLHALRFVQAASVQRGVLLFLTFCCLGLTRPTAAPLLAALSLWVVLARYSLSILSRLSVMAFGMTLAVGLALIIKTIYMPNNEPALGILGFAVRGIFGGEVIDDRPSTWVAPPESVLELSLFLIRRFIAFFSVTHEHFSLMHNLLNSLLAAYILLGVGAFVFHRVATSPHNEILRRFGVLIALLVGFVALFHSFILIDYDWRYRYPLIDPILVLATLGFAHRIKPQYSAVRGASRTTPS